MPSKRKCCFRVFTLYTLWLHWLGSYTKVDDLLLGVCVNSQIALYLLFMLNYIYFFCKGKVNSWSPRICEWDKSQVFQCCDNGFVFVLPTIRGRSFSPWLWQIQILVLSAMLYKDGIDSLKITSCGLWPQTWWALVSPRIEMRKSAIPYIVLSVHCLLKSDSNLLILSTGWTFQLVWRCPTLKAVAFMAERTPTWTKVLTVTPCTAK